MPSTTAKILGAAFVALFGSMLMLGETAAQQKSTTAARPTAQPAAPAAPAGQPQLVLESRDWKAVTAQPAKGKMCYAIAKPQKLEPGRLDHGDVFFFISSRPSDKVANEPSLQVGYPLKDQSTVSVDIDGQKFEFFTQGDGAWLRDKAEERRFVDALKKGSRMQIAATSGRGNATSYLFSLSGVTNAVEAAAKECR